MRSDIGIIGLDDIGIKIALEIEKAGYSVSIFDFSETHEPSKALKILFDYHDKRFRAGEDLLDFVVSLSSPRLIIIGNSMSESYDHTQDILLSVCTLGDILIDVTNAPDVEVLLRRAKVEIRGLHYVHFREDTSNIQLRDKFDILIEILKTINLIHAKPIS